MQPLTVEMISWNKHNSHAYNNELGDYKLRTLRLLRNKVLNKITPTTSSFAKQKLMWICRA